MSTIVFFQGDITTHITDVCVCGETRYRFIETGRVYTSERIAIKRAFVYYKRKAGISDKVKRVRRQIFKTIRKRRQPIAEPIIVRPTIYNYFEYGKEQFKVIETGRIWETFDEAIKDAIDYAAKRNIC